MKTFVCLLALLAAGCGKPAEARKKLLDATTVPPAKKKPEAEYDSENKASSVRPPMRWRN